MYRSDVYTDYPAGDNSDGDLRRPFDYTYVEPLFSYSVIYNAYMWAVFSIMETTATFLQWHALNNKPCIVTKIVTAILKLTFETLNFRHFYESELK